MSYSGILGSDVIEQYGGDTCETVETGLKIPSRAFAVPDAIRDATQLYDGHGGASARSQNGKTFHRFDLRAGADRDVLRSFRSTSRGKP